MRTLRLYLISILLAVTLVACGLLGAEPNFWVVPDRDPWVVTTAPGDYHFSVAVYRVGGFMDPVEVTLLGLPVYIDYVVDPDPVEGLSAVVTLTVSEGAGAGAVSITLVGTSGELVRDLTFTLVVGEPEPPG